MWGTSVYLAVLLYSITEFMELKKEKNKVVVTVMSAVTTYAGKSPAFVTKAKNILSF